MKINENLFPERLKEVMEDNNLTIYSVGEALNLSAATISRYMNGLVSPKLPVIETLSLKYNVNPVWLMGISNEKYLNRPSFIKVPILGKIACGLPLLAEENIIDYEFAEYSDNVDFALIARGDSMINARIYDGDIVFIRRQDDVNDGEIAAVLIDDEATLKRVYKLNGDLLLKAENPMREDMRITAKDRKQVKILGKAVAFKSRLI
ncbi:helix-turn-helix domain-containing protein [Sedimentibacter hydroxybenzoicus DSM 7310]|uniref:Helix-turn-helix domain-containing protein n=1 Tax=Sedimentibacter hydroxybenzoicus DSM 7310 TaxID=1123245 RepID=A0A974GW30_SEDHY|nr:XRE family transcriptional regulator [Sedimentibacter hydroxybenzoicus]NYB73896.1 helix-turn-helix domain-containing protein [Sedimentibacter hydroxybenzoicus DSM 7310]